MDVEVQRGADAGMAQEGADRLVVAVALDAAGGEAVTEGVEIQARQVQLFQQAQVKLAVGIGLFGDERAGDDVAVGRNYSFYRRYQYPQLGRQGDVPAGCLCLGRANHDGGAPFSTCLYADAFDGPLYGKRTGFRVDVRPAQGTDFADTQSHCQTDVDAEIPVAVMSPDVLQQFPVVGDGQHLYLLLFRAGVLDVPRSIDHPALFCTVLDDHPEHHEHVPDRFVSHSVLQFLPHEPLHVVFRQCGQRAERRKKVFSKCLPVRGHGGRFHQRAFLCCPDNRNFFKSLSHNVLFKPAR